MRRLFSLPIAAAAGIVIAAAPAGACGGLIGPRGSVSLVRTSTLAAYRDGVEHYVTAFKFAGGGGQFGSIVPLPGIPTKVEKGGAWTLQRLEREIAPVVEDSAFRARGAGLASAPARVILETRVGALDLTVLEGGGASVGDWARAHGFALPPDAPEVLDFYASRSPIFLAGRFDGAAAAVQGVERGDGTPVHLTIPTKNPWVPLRILALGKDRLEPVDADVFLLTPAQPGLLPTPGAAFGRPGSALRVASSAPASAGLLADLRSDRGMEWLPASDMWLTAIRIDGPAGAITHDLAIDAEGGQPSRTTAGLPHAAAAVRAATRTSGHFPWLAVSGAGLLLALVALGGSRVRTLAA